MRLWLPSSPLLALAALVVVAALLLGGETRAGFVGDVVVQALAVPLLLLSVAQIMRSSGGMAKRQDILIPILVVTAIFAVIVVLQLVPLPPNWWSALSRAPVALAESFTLNAGKNWRALSLTPNATWIGAASLIVPCAVFVATIQFSDRERCMMMYVILAVAVAALVLGYLQVAQGAGSAFRFASFTNQSEAVGFFANRNHFAALLYCTLVFAGVWFADVLRAAMLPGTINTRAVLWFAAATALLIAVFVGLAMARSRAGILLGVLSSVAMIGIVMARIKSPVPKVKNAKSNKLHYHWAWLLVIGMAFVAAVEFGLYRSVDRFSHLAYDDARLPINWTTFEIALRNLPFGTGIGSFVPVYAASEKQFEAAAFINRAHNDFAELVLETGVLGIFCIVAFVAWSSFRAVKVWRNQDSQELSSHDLLQRAATIVILLLLVHSAVDYPLRTTALSTVFAFCCALLISSTRCTSEPRKARNERAFANKTSNIPRATETEPPSGTLWITDVELPEAWQKQTPNDIRRRREKQ